MAIEDTDKITELSWTDFEHLPDLTLNQVREFCSSRGLGKRDIDIYDLLASKNIFADVRADLAVSCIAQAVKEGKADFQNREYELGKLKYADIIAGYKKYPDALKELGVNMPDVVAIALNKDSSFDENADVKFVVKTMATNADTYEQSMQQIAEKGFKAGYGAEKMVYKFKKYLNNLEKLKAVHQELDAFRNEAIKRIGRIFSPELNISAQSVVDAALAKAHGENYTPFRPEKRVSILKGFIIGWKNRAVKNAAIKKQEQKCKAVNKLVDEFAERCKKSSVLHDYKNYADIKRYLNSGKTADDYEKLSAKFLTLYQNACKTLLKQTETARTAYKTSGLYNTENDVGIDVIAAKAEVREKNQKISVRELYEKSGLIATKSPEKVKDVAAGLSVKEKQIAKEEQEVKEEQDVKKEGNTNNKEVKNSVPAKKLYPLPENLKSKNPHIQKAIDLVRSDKYATFEEMKADKENFGKLPRYARDTARMLFATSHHSTEWDTERKKAAYAKRVVLQAEASVKAGLNKLSVYSDPNREKQKKDKQKADKQIKKINPKITAEKILSNISVRSA